MDQRATGPIAAEAPIVIDMAAALDRAARRTEQQPPLHRRPYRRVKPIANRPSILDPHRSEIVAPPPNAMTLRSVSCGQRGSAPAAVAPTS